jgi:hypothetical protein
MAVQWNGLDAGLAPGFPEAISAAVGPLPWVYVITSGKRTVAEQNGLWQQGRDAYGNVINLQAIVTNARGTDSPHVFGLAVDMVPMVNGVALWEPTDHPAWQALFGAVYASPVLHSGRTFSTIPGGDYDHVERLNWRLYVPVGAAAEATGTPGTPGSGGGAGVPRPDGSVDTASSNAPPLDSPLASDVATWLELDPGVAIGAAAILGVLFLLWLAKR